MIGRFKFFSVLAVELLQCELVQSALLPSPPQHLAPRSRSLFRSGGHDVHLLGLQHNGVLDASQLNITESLATSSHGVELRSDLLGERERLLEAITYFPGWRQRCLEGDVAI